MKAERTRWLAACALIAYTAILMRFVVFKAIPVLCIGHLRLKFAHTHTGPGNFIPFKTIVPELVSRGNHLIAMVNLLGNILPFIPIGLLSPLVVRSVSWQKALLFGVVTGVSFEVMEVVFRVGIFDVDDVLLNAFGFMVGYGAWVLLKLRAQPRLGEPSSPVK
jgi:glycopeptide antibiotics resistance protein